MTIEQDRETQIALGWDLNHPEAFCNRCDRPNIAWFTNSPDWNRATAVMPLGKAEILCPVCFVAAWEAATGVPSSWEMVPTVSTLARLHGDSAPTRGNG